MPPQDKYLVSRYLIKERHSSLLSAGTIMHVSDDFPRPVGWLECDGSEYDPEQYPDLHQMLQRKRNIYAKRSVIDRVLRRKPKKIGEETYGIYGVNRLPDLGGFVAYR